MKIAILGDFIIDEFLEYKSKKLSPESPCPIVNFENNMVAGGAANVANSCHSMGLDVIYIYANDIKSPKNYESLLLIMREFSKRKF